MLFDNLFDLSRTIRKYEYQAWDAERRTSSSMAACFSLVFFTYALLFIPISLLEGSPAGAVVYGSGGMILLGLLSLAYAWKLKFHFKSCALRTIPFWGMGYHSIVLITILWLWLTGTNVSITPFFIVVICLGFTWLHILQYILYITVLLIVSLVTISLVDFNHFWFLEFVTLYLFAVSLHIFHVSHQCRLFESQQMLEDERNVDGLTGLLNRRALEEAFSTPSAEGSRMAAILIDLDHFKSVNDTFGHAAGDQALTCAADIFKRVFRRSDLVARLGGDEFFIVLQLGDDAEAILKRKVEQLLRQVPLDFCGEAGRVSVTFSVGAYLTREDEKISLDDMIAQADSAMYTVKQAGRNHALLRSKDAPEVILRGMEFAAKVIQLS